MKRTILIPFLAIVLVSLAAGAAFAQTGSAATAEPGDELDVPGEADGDVAPADALGPEADPALYAVGALGASNLYATYFLLGTLADGYATDAYTVSFADELARDVIGLSESSVDVLEELLTDDGLVGEDRRLVREMIRAHTLLINQAWGLISYIEDAEDTDDWFRYRRAAWELITELLQIE
jgi:hypothetical protein